MISGVFRVLLTLFTVGTCLLVVPLLSSLSYQAACRSPLRLTADPDLLPPAQDAVSRLMKYSWGYVMQRALAHVVMTFQFQSPPTFVLLAPPSPEIARFIQYRHKNSTIYALPQPMLRATDRNQASGAALSALRAQGLKDPIEKVDVIIVGGLVFVSNTTALLQGLQPYLKKGGTVLLIAPQRPPSPILSALADTAAPFPSKRSLVRTALLTGFVAPAWMAGLVHPTGYPADAPPFSGSILRLTHDPSQRKDARSPVDALPPSLAEDDTVEEAAAAAAAVASHPDLCSPTLAEGLRRTTVGKAFRSAVAVSAVALLMASDTATTAAHHIHAMSLYYTGLAAVAGEGYSGVNGTAVAQWLAVHHNMYSPAPPAVALHDLLGHRVVRGVGWAIVAGVMGWVAATALSHTEALAQPKRTAPRGRGRFWRGVLSLIAWGRVGAATDIGKGFVVGAATLCACRTVCAVEFDGVLLLGCMVSAFALCSAAALMAQLAKGGVELEGPPPLRDQGGLRGDSHWALQGGGVAAPSLVAGAWMLCVSSSAVVCGTLAAGVFLLASGVACGVGVGGCRTFLTRGLYHVLSFSLGGIGVVVYCVEVLSGRMGASTTATGGASVTSGMHAATSTMPHTLHGTTWEGVGAGVAVVMGMSGFYVALLALRSIVGEGNVVYPALSFVPPSWAVALLRRIRNGYAAALVPAACVFGIAVWLSIGAAEATCAARAYKPADSVSAFSATVALPRPLQKYCPLLSRSTHGLVVGPLDVPVHPDVSCVGHIALQVVVGVGALYYLGPALPNWSSVPAMHALAECVFANALWVEGALVALQGAAAVSSVSISFDLLRAARVVWGVVVDDPASLFDSWGGGVVCAYSIALLILLFSTSQPTTVGGGAVPLPSSTPTPLSLPQTSLVRSLLHTLPSLPPFLPLPEGVKGNDLVAAVLGSGSGVAAEDSEVDAEAQDVLASVHRLVSSIQPPHSTFVHPELKEVGVPLLKFAGYAARAVVESLERDLDAPMLASTSAQHSSSPPSNGMTQRGGVVALMKAAELQRVGYFLHTYMLLKHTEGTGITHAQAIVMGDFCFAEATALANGVCRVQVSNLMTESAASLTAAAALRLQVPLPARPSHPPGRDSRPSSPPIFSSAASQRCDSADASSPTSTKGNRVGEAISPSAGGNVPPSVATIGDAALRQLLEERWRDYYTVSFHQLASLFAKLAEGVATVVGGGEEECSVVRIAGAHFGLAVQLLCDAAQFEDLNVAKATLSQYRCSVVTAPVLFAAESSPGAVVACLTSASTLPADVQGIAKAVTQCGAVATTRALARKHLQGAVGAVVRLPPGSARTSLLRFIFQTMTLTR